jgi:4-hydroxythreonine-4-phosphate dehydrogenase
MAMTKAQESRLNSNSGIASDASQSIVPGAFLADGAPPSAAAGDALKMQTFPAAVAKPLAITMGDAAGIGPEIIAKAYASQAVQMQGSFVAGDVQAMRRASALVGQFAQSPAWPVLHISDPQAAMQAPPRCIPVFQVGAPMRPVCYGQVSAAAGEFAGRCVQWAAQQALDGGIAAVVTAPLNKQSLSAAGPPFDRFPGHTELLQALAAEHAGVPVERLPVRMMLANQELRTVLLSIHMSLRQAIEAVTEAAVLETINITDAALRPVLGRAPRIAVAGLNPHAGEGGLFGHEEQSIIGPAIAAARQAGCDASGPWPPDTVFMQARAGGPEARFDVVIAMYHDQGLIPVKYLGVEQGVNLTLGMPFVRTSPDHGTAFDIAGKGLADASSLLAAVSTARHWTGARRS